MIRSWWFLQVTTLLLVFTTAPCSPNGVVGTLRSFRDVLVAPETTRAIQEVPFDPDAGINFRNGYQKRFGYRGMGLIDKLGRGYTKQQLVTFGALTPWRAKSWTKKYHRELAVHVEARCDILDYVPVTLHSLWNKLPNFTTNMLLCYFPVVSLYIT